MFIRGGGGSGLISAFVMKQAGFDVTVFERCGFSGGVWNYEKLSSQNNHARVDSSSIYKKSFPMYPHLLTNIAVECMSINDQFPFVSDSYASFLHNSAVLDYLNQFKSKCNLEQSIIYHTEVLNCEYGPTEKKWSVETKDTRILNHSSKINTFDFVVVCNGHFQTPFLPRHTIENMETFTGDMIHSIEYETPVPFAEKRVLIVGAHPSGGDVAKELAESKLTTSLHLSDRNQVVAAEPIIIMDTNRSPLYIHPAIKSVIPNSNIVEFTDGSTVEIDIIVWCTGYTYDCPFLAHSRSITELINAQVPSYLSKEYAFQGVRKMPYLYQQLLFIPEPSLAFIALPYAVTPFPLAFVQALVVATVFKQMSHYHGHVVEGLSAIQALPSKDEMWRWLDQFNSVHLDTYRYHCLAGEALTNYFRTILPLIDPSCFNANFINMERLYRCVGTFQEIFAHTNKRRPRYPGAKNDYREMKYIINWDDLSWSVIGDIPETWKYVD
jgi:hypothetical protein